MLMSAQGQGVPDIAHLLDCSPEYARGVICAFNDAGFAALDPEWSEGRPKTTGEPARRQIRLIARCCPRDLDLPFSAWSLGKPAGHAVAAGLAAAVSRESLRQILRAAGISWQAARTWKASAGPGFIAKMRRVPDLHDHPPADGRVVCAGEFGPLNLQPRAGRGWRPAGHLARLRAPCSRPGGARHMIAAPDLATGKMIYRIRARQRRREFPAFITLARQRWPGQKLYAIVDNFS
jgi:transposase